MTFDYCPSGSASVAVLQTCISFFRTRFKRNWTKALRSVASTSEQKSADAPCTVAVRSVARRMLSGRFDVRDKAGDAPDLRKKEEIEASRESASVVAQGEISVSNLAI